MKKGFTLIELLVVIAIIAILAAILFPVFAKAREKARQISCASNEKQLSLSMLQYVQDYDETYPGLVVNGKFWPGEVYPYVKSKGVYFCPDDSASPTSTNPDNMTACLAGSGGCAVLSYGLNAGLNRYDPTFNSVGRTLAEINNPSDLCLLAENIGDTVTGQSYGGFASSGQNGWAPVWYSDLSGGNKTPTPNDSPGFGTFFGTPIARHTGVTNIAFADGHVKAIQFAGLYTPPSGVTPANFKLWHADAQ